MGSDFIKEETKKKPFNKEKFIKKLLVSAACALVFGVVFSLVFLLLTPTLQKLVGKTTTTENVGIITLPENNADMSPEDLLSDYMLQESALYDKENEEGSIYEGVEMPLTDEQIQAILSGVTLDVTSYRQMSISMAALGREMAKNMVTVTSSSYTVDWMNSVNNSKNVTSGVVIAKNNVDMFIVVDSSRIKQNDELVVSFYNGVSCSGELKAVDSNTGIAVVTVSISSIPTNYNLDDYIATLGSSNGLFVGLPVMAVGSPKGVAGSMGYGIIDVPKKNIPQMDSYVSAIQTNISGSSIASGALFNLQGQVIGIITNKIESSSGEKVIVAYGISELKNRIEKMSNNIDINYLGIITMDVTDEAVRDMGIPKGAYIVSVKMDSPSMREGIQTGDVIVRVDGNPVNSISEYMSYLNQKNIDDTIHLEVMRKSKDGYTSIEFDLVVEATK
ncbi:MAG: S1C family serine protease [Lachnospiraceae bacterium]|nr:S1C family serine protease [Lachnospiraceae bacterium]